MNIGIHCKGFSLTRAIAGHVNKRIELLRGRGIRGLRRVDVALSNLNRARGEIDKRCIIKVRVDGLIPVVIEDVQSDLYAAIDRAAGRALRVVQRRLAEQRKHNIPAFVGAR